MKDRTKVKDPGALRAPCASQEETGGIVLDYCAGALDPARAAEFKKHLGNCPGCRALVDAQRDVWETLDQWKPAPVSPDFDARLYARIAQEEAAPGWQKSLRRIFSPAALWSIWKPAVPLAAAGAVLMVGFLVRMPAPDHSAKQIRAEKVDIEQVERTLEDLDMLTPVSPAPARSM